MVSYFKKFEALDFGPVYSDVHHGLSFEIESMLECNHLRPDKIESTNHSEKHGFVTKRPCSLKEKLTTLFETLMKKSYRILKTCSHFTWMLILSLLHNQP